MNANVDGASGGSFLRGLAVGAVLGLMMAVAGWALAVALDGEDTAAEQARELIEENYFRDVEPEILDEASARGMVAELRRRFDDRFSHYFGPKALRALNAATSGEFSGVGLTVSEIKEGLRVADVLPNSPAKRADIKEGDVITAVDGKSIAGKPAQVSAGQIKGKPGTEVEITVEPVSGSGARDVRLRRAEVRLPAVDGEIRNTGPPSDERRVAYVRYATFSSGAHGELRETVERLYRQGAEGLLLDLRGNGGGLLNEAVLSAGLFVEDGVVVSTSSRSSGDQDYEAAGEALDPRPTVVLINRDTASAAEILAAALDDYNLATLVGTRTYGKNTVQEVLPLDPGGALDLTIGEYVTSEGQSLAGEGVQPEVDARDNPSTDPDEALDVGLAELRGLLGGR